MQFERGYKSPYFVTDNNTMDAVLDNPYILIVNGRISTANSLLNVLNQASGEDRPILIVAEDIDGEALATLIVNKMRGTVRVCAVKAPEFGDRRTMALEDLAIITGGNVISKDKGHKLDKITPIMFKDTFLGTARKVTISKDTTTIVDGGGDIDDISGRIEEIKFALDNQSSAFEKEKLQERLGKLVGGVAIINVGGNSELEIKEKKDRVEDALFATKAALDEGIVVGGGTALLYASGDIKIEGNDDKAIGRRIVAKSVSKPFYKILTNAGHENNEVRYIASKLIDSGNDLWTGLDYKTLETIDFKKAGIIDPKKVTRIALENAASIAGTILTTESVVYKTKDDKEEEVNPMAGLM